jgi:hypothetical protein
VVVVGGGGLGGSGGRMRFRWFEGIGAVAGLGDGGGLIGDGRKSSGCEIEYDSTGLSGSELIVMAMASSI